MSKLALHGGSPVSDRPIPIACPVFSTDEIEAAAAVLRSGAVRQGPWVERFEQEFARTVGSRHACAVSSGTAALHVAYLATLQPGDEIIVPAFTFIATAAAAAFAGARPIFADIDPLTFTVDPEDVERKLTPRTRAIAPVHLFGNAADMGAIVRIASARRLFIIGDLAQSHLTKIDGKDVGSFDHLNCYSFYPTKNMTTTEGGMITTNDDELCEKMKLLRSHGQAGKYYHTMLGLNYRMTDVAAAIGVLQLEKLPANTRKRQRNAAFLSEHLKDIEGIQVPVVREGVEHTFHQYSILLERGRFSCSRDEFAAALRAENIECAVHYPVPLTRQPVFREAAGSCPVAEEISERVLSLPVHPHLDMADLERVVEGVRKVASYYRS